MIVNFSRLIRLITLLFLLLVVSSCEPGCVQPYEFDSEIDRVESHPEDFIENTGSYNHITGGQRVFWKDLGIRADGNQVILSISGSWVPWDTSLVDGDLANDKALSELPVCTLCFKKSARDKNGNVIGSSPNCLCQAGQKPVAHEFTQDGIKNPLSVNCNTETNQNDPNLCTCSTYLGSPTDLDVFMIATDYQTKDGAEIHPIRQQNCKFDKGAGLYLGLFGPEGNSEPLRVYHLYATDPTDPKCDVSLNSEGKCVDSQGKDITRYIYRSANGMGFVRDDKSGNNGTDTNSADDEYHDPGEKVKLMIYDRYYDDNYGAYNIEFLSGIIKTETKGLLETIVRTVEEPLLGKISAAGKREGGAIKYLYENIVKDSTFILFVRVILVLYITLFGFGILAGLVKLARKEITTRMLKIALVMMFTTSTSWAMYDYIVIGFFKDGMDAIVAMFMSLTDANIGKTSLITVAQEDRAVAVSNATRFSYMDYVIMKLLSFPVAKKIWGLFFGTFFGFLYIPMIYGLVAFFVYVALLSAFIYISTMLKLVFVLALGPLFIISSLFSKTEGIFKRWLTFLASRSIEIIVLFLVIYTFLIMIDKGFNDLLFVEACTKVWDWWIIKFDVIETKSDRSFIGWVSAIIKIAALIFLMKLIIEKIPGFVSSLVQIDDTPAKAPGIMASGFMKDVNSSATGIFGALAGEVKEIASDFIKKGLPTVARYTVEGAGFISRTAGFDDKLDKFKEAIPFRGPLKIARDYFMIDSVIKNKQKEGIAKGLSGKDLDEYIRRETMNSVDQPSKQPSKGSSMYAANRSAIFGLGPDAVAKRLDAKLVDKPLEDFLRSRFEEIKNSNPNVIKFGDELKDQLRQDVKNWAQNNSSILPDDVVSRLDNSKFSALINRKGELSTSDAARLFAGNNEMQQKYRQHLMDMKYEREVKLAKSKWYDKPKLAAELLRAETTRNTAYNPNRNLENFERKLRYVELSKQDAESNSSPGGWLKNSITGPAEINTAKGFSLVKRVNFLDKMTDSKDGEFTAKSLAVKAEKEALGNYFSSGYRQDLNYIEQKYQSDLKEFRSSKEEIEAGKTSEFAQRKATEMKEKRLKQFEKKREAFKEKLVNATKEDFARSVRELDMLKALEIKEPGKHGEKISELEKSLNDKIINNEFQAVQLEANKVLLSAGIVLVNNREELLRIGGLEGIKQYTSTSGANSVIASQIDAIREVSKPLLDRDPDLKAELEKAKTDARNNELENLRNQSLAVLYSHLKALNESEKVSELNDKEKETLKNFYNLEELRVNNNKQSKFEDRQSKANQLNQLKTINDPSEQDKQKIRSLELELSKLDSDIDSLAKMIETIKNQKNIL